MAANQPTEVVDLTGDDDEEGLNPNHNNNEFFVELSGNPRPMGRPRKYRNHWMSPSKKAVNEMKKSIMAARPIDEVMFPAGIPVAVEIRFYMRRPNSHFKRGVRWHTDITASAAMQSVQPFGADIDNLAKLVLDAMNKAIYQDDNQVVKLIVTKWKDNNYECEGRTVVVVKRYTN